jgi:Putative DNA-binding domain
MTSALQLAQSNLLQALAGQTTFPYNPRGLQVYQANRAVLAERTLASTYPVIAQLIGAESFEPLARHFWQQHPPQRGDMGQWGEHLADFLEAAPQLADEPFLGDVARLEWALHCAAGAQDVVLDAPSFALLSDDAPVSLAFSPGTCILLSAYPVVSLINAHLSNQPTLDEAADLLRQGQGELALVWRHGYKPMVRELDPAEYRFINALQKGAALEAALDTASGSEPAFDFNAWLGQAVQRGLITGAVQLQ